MPPSEDDILVEAREHLTRCLIEEKDIRDESERCDRFLALEQWTQEDKDARGSRPTVVIDQTGQYVDQVKNDWRRNRMGIKVSPGDGPADDETARILDGMIRQIEHQSKAHVAYDNAFEQMVGSNRGFCQVSTRRRPGSFKKDIVILKIPDKDTVYLDPFYDPFIKDSVCERALKTTKVSRSRFKEKYGLEHIPDFEQATKVASAWFPDSDNLLVGEYWKREETPRKIQQLTKPIAVIRNGNAMQTDTVYDDEWDPKDAQFDGVEVATNSDGQAMEDDEPKVTVWQYLLYGLGILDKTRWEGDIIPIVPWYGKEQFYKGRRKLFSLISRSLDAQKVFNYAQSSMCEKLGQATRTPVIGVVGQFKTQRAAWEQANSQSFAFLEYDPVAIGDKPAPPPQRADFDPRIDQAVEASQITKDNIRGTVGINTAILGQDTGKAKSGAAIRALSEQGDNGTFDFLDNGGRSIELVGDIVVDLIPKIYPRAEIVQIRDEQQKVISIAINQADPSQWAKDQQRAFFLGQGKYHVAVSAAPSHDTLRREGQDMAMELLKILPPENQKTAIAVSLRLQDWFGAKEIANAIDPPQEGLAKIPPQVIQQMQMMGKMIEAQTQEIHALNDQIDNKKLELTSQERQTALKVWQAIKVAEIQASKDLDKTDADIEAKHLQQIFDQAHETGLQAMQHAQTLEQNEQEGQIAQDQQAADQQFQSQQTTQQQQHEADQAAQDRQAAQATAET